tara:strand:- start:45 stop:494 length:450 start_codon:yes stop_codon:yes gene_type:complete
MAVNKQARSQGFVKYLQSEYDKMTLDPQSLVANAVGLSKEDIDWAKSQDKRYPKKEQLDGRGDAARHLALGFISQRSKNPKLALKASNMREYLELDNVGRPLDIFNNNLGATIKASSYEEAEKIIDDMIKNNKAKYLTRDKSDQARGYN